GADEERGQRPLAAGGRAVPRRVLLSDSFFSRFIDQNELYFAIVPAAVLLFQSHFSAYLNWLYGFYVVN
ncbi:TPA: hypothetical protein ACXL4G_006903, partial [Klebsiella michiganensis]